MNFGNPLHSADRLSRRPRKGMFLLPSLFTTANIAAGFYAITQTVAGSATEPWHFDFAAKAIGFAVLFDGLDGAVARMTNTSTDFGRELDSLADVVTFGVAPALLAWQWGFSHMPLVLNADLRGPLMQIGIIACFLFLVAGAARLARFNITTNPQPKNPGRPGRKYFVGMPIPGGAGCVAAVVHFRLGQPVMVWWISAAWIVYIGLVAFLMVSTWRFWSAKGIDVRRQHPSRVIILLALIGYGIWEFSRFVLIAMALAYMVSGVLARVAYSLGRRSELPPAPPQEISGVS
ncbi:MAG TPA: phosphatidylcholine/phosphatidylserine synthase [candidate division Zixibacteria bacterium]|nr:phosphatidylcholine/phosphatidylserine synthase [candidate division Zixibacteria bacterium]